MSPTGFISKFIVQALQENTEDKSFIIFRNKNDSELNLLFERLICEYLEKSKSNEVIDAWMIIILSRLLNNFSEDNYSDIYTDRPNKILEILHYLEENYKTTTLKSSAQYFGFNPNYYSNYLKKILGKHSKS